MTVTTTELLTLGKLAAESWNDCDVALAQVQDSFGIPFEAAKDNLLRDVTLAESQGIDLTSFSGTNSRFKFPEYGANIVIRVQRKPTPHVKLEKLAAKVAKLEAELKLAKMQLKHTAEQLVQSKECDEVTDKITLAFTRLK
jgi:hypothetical protein